jgi:hypothetical protein
VSLKHIFISHAGADLEAANWLAARLKDAGHDTAIDTRDLSLGDNSVVFMNEGIAEAHTVIILLSKNSKDAVWQMAEINAAIWNEIAQNGGQCIVIKLDDTDVPPLLGPKVYGKLNIHDTVSSRTLVEKLCKAAVPDPDLSLVEVIRATSRNPFRYLRAEFFEDRPDLHAKAFAPPDALTVGALEEMKPCLLEGSRGTGKSMLLLSLRARNFRSRHGDDSSRIFGFYLKLSHGAICNVGVVAKADEDPFQALGASAMQISDIAEQEIIIQLLESIFSELSFCMTSNLIDCSREVERRLAQDSENLLFEGGGSTVVSLEDLLERLGDAHKRVAGFIRRRFIYGETCSVPFTTFDREQLNRVIKLVRRHVSCLEKTTFVALLDEYENLFRYQQKIINTLVKLGPPQFSVKIAKKLGSGHTSGTTTGQWLEETHDYTRLPLVYDVEDSAQRIAYRDLLCHIVKNIFRSEGLGEVNVDQLLPEAFEPEVPDEKVEAEILKLIQISKEDFEKLPEPTQREKRTYFREAAIYRVLLRTKGRRTPKRFSGFKELAFVSSGVIRYFQEILGVAYHLSFDASEVRPSPLVLPPDKQTRAVHFVSQHNLTTISRNVEQFGESLKYFVLDLGDCLRHKLLRHNSEPEAARLTLLDPENLQDPSMLLLKQILAAGVAEGVFQTKEGLPAYKPKHTSDPQPAEFNICRMFAPVLEISPRLRMRTAVRCELLRQLLANGSRGDALQKLKSEMVRVKLTGQPTGQVELRFAGNDNE